MTLTPAYNRDYTSQATVRAAWEADHDFIVADISSPWVGRPANRSDLREHAQLTEVNIRYARLREIVTVKV